MSTFSYGSQDVSFDNFQELKIKEVSPEASGFELAYLAHWPYILCPGAVHVPPDLIGLLKANAGLFIPDNRNKFTTGWSFLPAIGYSSYIVSESEEISEKNTQYQLRFNTSVKKMWPELESVILGLPFDVESATIFALQPGSSIALHADKATRGVDKLLIPLNRPENSIFAFYQFGAVPLETGRIYSIDGSYPHYAVNQSSEVRYNMVIRGRFEPKLNLYFEWLKKGFTENGRPHFNLIPPGDKWLPPNILKG